MFNKWEVRGRRQKEKVNEKADEKGNDNIIQKKKGGGGRK